MRLEIITQVFISFVALGLGSAIFLKPHAFIELQKRFYLLINWRMEPVSWAKEIRNTKVVGLILLMSIAVIWVGSLFRAF